MCCMLGELRPQLYDIFIRGGRRYQIFETATRFSTTLAGGLLPLLALLFRKIAKPLSATPLLRNRYHCPHPIKDSEREEAAGRRDSRSPLNLTFFFWPSIIIFSIRNPQ